MKRDNFNLNEEKELTTYLTTRNTTIVSSNLIILI